jgi:hypothetical protein
MERSIEFLIAFTLSVMAVYRLSYLVSNEDGPFDFLSKLREWIGQKNWIGRGINCLLCVSFWLSVFPALWLYFEYDKPFVLSWLAIATGCLIIHRKR